MNHRDWCRRNMLACCPDIGFWALPPFVALTVRSDDRKQDDGQEGGGCDADCKGDVDVV
jgi:hypothetical protein